jgi:outer membrane protein insertion porin family
LGGRKPQSFGVSYNYTVSRQIDFRTNSVYGQLNVVNVSVSLGRRLKVPDDYFTLSNAISYARYGLENYPIIPGLPTGVSNSFTFNTTLSRNSIDNPMFPRGGSSVTLSAALTPPYSLFNGIDYESASASEKYKFIEYHKWMFDSKYYLQLVGNLVLETRAHFGYVGSYQQSTGTSPFEKFVLGGSGLSGGGFQIGTDIIGLRGYTDNSLSPEDQSARSSGTLYNKFVMELRYPVSLNPSATIYVLGFAEAGNNWSSFKTYNPNKLYKSSGVGVRIFMPAFGLLGIDWGYGFDPEPGQIEKSGGQIHFSIGQTLR